MNVEHFTEHPSHTGHYFRAHKTVMCSCGWVGGRVAGLAVARAKHTTHTDAAMVKALKDRERAMREWESLARADMHVSRCGTCGTQTWDGVCGTCAIHQSRTAAKSAA